MLEAKSPEPAGREGEGGGQRDRPEREQGRQAARQAYQSQGYLTGSAWIRRGRKLAWTGLVLALTSLVIASIAGLLHLAGAPGGPDFAPGTD